MNASASVPDEPYANIPPDFAKMYEALPGTKTTFDTAWRRDEWINAEGLPNEQGEMREYLVHTESPRFRCRVVTTDPFTRGLPEPHEDPADIAVSFKADVDTGLAEVEWLDPCPDVPQLFRLLEAASNALDQLDDEIPSSPAAGKPHQSPARSEQADRQPWSAQDIQFVASLLHGSPSGADEALAERLSVDTEEVQAWMSGARAIPGAMIERIRKMVGAGDPVQETWRREEWIVGDGSQQANGRRREYILHLLTPRFRCRVVEVDPDTGLPQPHEHPADVITGVTYSVDDNTVLAEFEWFDPCPDTSGLTHLLGAAEAALRQSAS